MADFPYDPRTAGRPPHAYDTTRTRPLTNAEAIAQLVRLNDAADALDAQELARQQARDADLINEGYTLHNGNYYRSKAMTAAEQTPPPPFDAGQRMEDISLMLKSLILALGFPEASFARTVKLDEITDEDVSRADLEASILTAFPDTDKMMLGGTETIGDVIDLILAEEQEAAARAEADAAGGLVDSTAEGLEASEPEGVSDAGAEGAAQARLDADALPPATPPAAPPVAPPVPELPPADAGQAATATGTASGRLPDVVDKGAAGQANDSDAGSSGGGTV